MPFRIVDCCELQIAPVELDQIERNSPAVEPAHAHASKIRLLRNQRAIVDAKRVASNQRIIFRQLYELQSASPLVRHTINAHNSGSRGTNPDQLRSQ